MVGAEIRTGNVRSFAGGQDIADTLVDVVRTLNHARAFGRELPVFRDRRGVKHQKIPVSLIDTGIVERPSETPFNAV